ncbi:hypothetical protein GCM10011363_39440 [Marivita lacus]|uniref:ATP-grasp domain-containing protein n=1 Tax=Marivita lacus TaxID=1323742 RepID=A0ABQ1L5N8_9RHOB|nr:acetate--CoA ligase family protein [Marivita lacus]GGC18870.1 hypothetical protein GCM10011363_39440 [Marivita lacus]
MLEIPGYSHASTQPVCVIGMTLPDSLSFDHPSVDAFLSNGFLVNELPFGNDDDRVRALCDRISFLANSLLQAIKVPVFEQAKIVELHYNQEKRAHRVRLLAPTVANIPREIVLRAHAFALKILNEMHPAYDFEAAFETIDADFVKKFKSFIPGGLSTVSVMHAAFKNRVPFLHLGDGVYQLGWGSKARRFDRSTNDKDTALGNKLASDKRLTNQILRQAGFPVPGQIAVSSLEAVQKAGQELGYPVVLKPAKLERGEGVTIDIDSDDALRDAYLEKQEAFENLLVEQQISGVCHRIFVAGKKVRHVVARHPMHVLGDGIHSISELARIENEAQQKLGKHRRRPKLEIDETSLGMFSQLGLDADSVPTMGLRVPFQRIESAQLGGIAEDLFSVTHSDNITLAEDVAEFCGLDVIGLDIITEDISKAWHENGAKINEINFAPMVSPYRDWVQKGLDTYVQESFPRQGRIPIHVFSGGANALSAARHYQSELFDKGKPHFLCSRDVTLKPDGMPCPDDLRDNLFLRAHALLLNKAAEGIIVVLQDESVLMTGFPFDSVSTKVFVDDQFVSMATAAPLGPDVRERIAQAVDQLPVLDGVA